MGARDRVNEVLDALQDEHYQRGVQDERKRLEPVIQKLRAMIAEIEFAPTPTPAQSPLFGDWQNSSDLSPFNPPRAGSDQERVLNEIKTNPGLRGVDIVNRLAGKVEERTVRTALHRLKNKELIMQLEGTWYPVEHAPQRETGQPG